MSFSFDQFTRFPKSVPSSHCELVCEGKCQLSSPFFIEKVRKLSLKLSHQVCSDLSLPDDLVTEDFVLYNQKNIFRFTCYKLLIQVSICCPDKETLNKVVHRLIELIEKEVQNKRLDQFNEFTMLLAWFATRNSDLGSLEKLLSNQDFDQYPKCFLQSLFSNSICHDFVEGVKFLLDKGALPHQSVWPGNYLTRAPISSVISGIVSLKDSVEEPDFPDKIDRMITIFEEVMKAIRKHTGMSPFMEPKAKTKFPDDTLFASLTSIAMISERAIKVIIEHAIDALIDSPRLVEVLEDAVELMFVDDEFEVTERPNILSDASCLAERLVLPLLRAGASHNVDDLWNFFEILEDNRINDCVSLTVWGRRDAFQDILMEMCVYNAGQVPACFQHAPEGRFPLSLAGYSRRSLLKAMPVGLKARSQAIDELPVPFWLKEYLRYTEFSPEYISELRERASKRRRISDSNIFQI